MAEYIVSSGVTSTGLTLSRPDIMNVMSGGVANNNTVNSRGLINVSEGGTAIGNTVNSRGEICVFSGGKVSNTTLFSGGDLSINSGGTAYKTTAVSGGALGVGSDGVADSVTVESGGRLYVRSGGTATNVVWTPCEGHVRVEFGGTASFVSKYSGVYFGSGGKLLSSATAMNGRTFENSCSMCVMNNGTANDTTVFNGDLLVYSGGMVNNTALSFHGYLFCSGGTANNTTINSGGSLCVSSGTANNVTVNSSGGLDVFYNGTVNSVTVNSSGAASVISGGVANNVEVKTGGGLFVRSGGTATNVVWTPCAGRVTCGDGGTITFASKYSGVYFGSEGELLSHAMTMNGIKMFNDYSGYYYMYVMSGGTATDTSGVMGFIHVSSGGTANNTSVTEPNLFVSVYNGGVINSTSIAGGGRVTLSSGGTANSTMVNRNGTLCICSGGTANSTTVLSGTFYLDGTANDVTLSYDGSFAISACGTANRTTVKNYSDMIVSYGGIANSTTVNALGSMYILNCGTANSTIVDSGGTMIFSTGSVFKGYAGGTASNVTVKSGGSLVICETESGTLTGRMVFETSAVVSMNDAAELNFDISKLSPGAAARVNNLSLIKGVPLYTLTVSASQAKGVYTLADGATGFGGTITVLNADGSETGKWLTVGKSVEIGDTEYALSLSGSKLALTVGIADKVAPTVSNIKATPTTPTNLTVTVTATFADDVKLAQSLYRIGEDGDWTDYKSGVTVDENTTVYFKAIDAAGNVSAPASYKVTNIDRIPPAAPKATADIVKPSIYPVNVSAEFSADSVKKEYSLDGKTWKNYSGAINFQENGSVYFRGTDAAGNMSETVCYNVTNILLEEPDPADDGWNDYLYDSKTKTLNDKVYRLAPQVIAKGDEEILLDAPGMIEYGEMHGFIGKSAEYGTIDPADYTKIRLNSAAKLSFLVSVTTAAKFTVWTLVEGTDKKTGATTYTMKSLMSITVKNVHADTSNKPLLLDAGDYYVSLESTNPKKAKEGYCSIHVDETRSEFYTRGDNSDDWTDMKEKGAAGHFGKLGTLSEDGVAVVSGEWVGTGDVVDYRQFKLAKATKLCFLVTSNGPVKFTVWQLNSKTDKKGVTTYSLKSLQSSTLKAPGYTFADSKGLMLDAGTYYFSVESTNAAKGGGADYEVMIAGSVFYTKGDNSDDWTDMKENGGYGMVGNAGVINASNKKVLSDWVGTGDAIDYKRFKLNSAAKLTFKLEAGDASKFTIWKLNAKYDKNKKSTYSLKSLQATTIKADVTATTKELLLDAGTYYFSMESTNAKKGADADYTVSTGNCVFFTRGDNSDDWGDMKKYGPDGMVGDVGEIYEDIGVILDDWVGYGDVIDYKKFTLDTDATLSFEVSAGDAAKFTVWRLDAKYSKTQVPNYSLKSLASVKLNGNSATTKAVKLTAGEYYFSMESTNAKKGGNAAYRVSLNMEASEFYYGDDYATGTGVRSAVDMCALPEPESELDLGFAETCAGSASGISMQDELFTGLDTLHETSLSSVDACLNSAPDKLFGESNGGLLASL